MTEDETFAEAVGLAGMLIRDALTADTRRNKSDRATSTLTRILVDVDNHGPAVVCGGALFLAGLSAEWLTLVAKHSDRTADELAAELTRRVIDAGTRG